MLASVFGEPALVQDKTGGRQEKMARMAMFFV